MRHGLTTQRGRSSRSGGSRWSATREPTSTARSTDTPMGPTEGFRFSAVPVKVRGFGTFPVRAYAKIEGGN